MANMMPATKPKTLRRASKSGTPALTPKKSTKPAVALVTPNPDASSGKAKAGGASSIGKKEGAPAAAETANAETLAELKSPKKKTVKRALTLGSGGSSKGSGKSSGDGDAGPPKSKKAKKDKNSEDALKKEKKPKKSKDPNAPKKPVTSFFQFMADNRTNVKAANPALTGKEVNSELARIWKEDASPEEKARYKADYDAKSAAWKIENDEYLKGKDGAAAGAAGGDADADADADENADEFAAAGAEAEEEDGEAADGAESGEEADDEGGDSSNAGEGKAAGDGEAAAADGEDAGMTNVKEGGKAAAVVPEAGEVAAEA